MSFADNGKSVIYYCNKASKTFHLYETWSATAVNTHHLDSSQNVESNHTPKVFLQLSLIVIRSLHYISGGAVDIEANNDKQIQDKYVKAVTSSLFETQYHLLDGFQYLVAHWFDAEAQGRSDHLKSGWVPLVEHKALKSYLPDNHNQAFGSLAPLEIATVFETNKDQHFEFWKSVNQCG